MVRRRSSRPQASQSAICDPRHVHTAVDGFCKPRCDPPRACRYSGRVMAYSEKTAKHKIWYDDDIKKWHLLCDELWELE